MVKQAFVLRIERVEACKFLCRKQRNAIALVNAVHRVDAAIQRDLQKFQQIDAGIRCSRGLPLNDELTTSKRHVLLCGRLVHPHRMHNGGNVDVIIVKRRIGRALPDRIESGVKNIFRCIPIHAQRKLRLHVAARLRHLHGDTSKRVCGFRIPSSPSARNDPPVDRCAPVLDHRPERSQQTERLVLVEQAGIEVMLEIGSQHIVHTSVIDNACKQRIQPEQLQSLIKGLRRIRLDLVKRVDHTAEVGGSCGIGRRQIPLCFFLQGVTAGPEQIEAFQRCTVKRIVALLFLQRGNSAPQPADSEFHQRAIIQHHTGKARRRDERVITVDKHADDVVLQRIFTVFRFEVVIQPICVQGINARMLGLRELLFKLGQLMKHAVMSDAANRRHTAEPDREKIQSARDQILRFDRAKQRRIQDAKARDLALFFRECGRRFMRLSISLHEAELLHGCELRREFDAHLYVLCCFGIECHFSVRSFLRHASCCDSRPSDL